MNLGESEAWHKLGYGLWRVAIPGGWLVASFGGGSVATAVTFVPDPKFAWDGRSAWATPEQADPSRRGAVSLAPEDP